MKKLLLLIVLAAALCASAFTASAGASNPFNCTVSPDQVCIGGYNYWNGHHIHNYGNSRMYCGAYQPNGTQQGALWVYPGEDKTISAWVYNHVVCSAETSQTTLWIYSFM